MANTEQQEGVQSFLGFTNFYRRFIQGFSDLARPMFDLTRKDPHAVGGKRRNQPSRPFDSCDLRSDSGIPDIPDPSESKPTAPTLRPEQILSPQSPETTESGTQLLLLQSLSAVERNYEIHDKEMLAVIRALEGLAPFSGRCSP